MTTTAARRADEIAPDDPAADKEFNARQLEKQRETLRELRRTRERLEERLEEVEDEVAERRMAGGDASDLLEERDELEEEIEWRDRAEPKLERRIRARSLRRLERLARERLQEITKRCGGLSGEQDRKVQRATEHLRKARDQLRRAGEAFALGRALESEAEVLARTFGLEVPETRRVPSAKSYDELRGAGDVRGWIGWSPEDALSTADRQASGASRARDEEPRDAVAKLEALDVDLDSPTAEILDRLADLEGEEGDA